MATHGGSLLPADAHGEPTHPIIAWMDSRSRDIVAGWKADGTAERIREISGWWPEPGLPLPSIAWLCQDQQEVWSKTARFLSISDYVSRRLTGSFCTSPSMAGEMLLTDLATGEWSQEICDLVGIQTNQLSPIEPSDTIIGPVRQDVCRIAGLSGDTVVINGGQDHSCEALALRMTEPGDTLLACGTAWVINGIIWPSSTDSLPGSMSVNAHVVPDRWTVSQYLGPLGAWAEWCLDRFWQPQARSSGSTARYSDFDQALVGTEPSSSGLLFMPDKGFIGLRLDHSRAEMGRAILEGAAIELRRALETMSWAGLTADKMWLVGGAAHSPHWPRILADVTGVPMRLTQYSHGPALGAAILASVAAGFIDSIDAAWDRFDIDAFEVAPDSTKRAVYDRLMATHEHMAHVLA
jgi:xylulokinase